MAKKTTAVTIQNGRAVQTAAVEVLPVEDKSIIAAQAKAMAVIPPVGTQIDALVVDDEESYKKMDALLGRIQTARREWGTTMEDIIRPISDGLQKLYKLNRSADKPLEALEARAKRKMADFKILELEQKRLEDAAREREVARLQKKLETVVQPTTKLRVEAQLAAVQEQTVETVKGENSAARPQRKIRVVDIAAFCGAIQSGLIPRDVVEVVQARLNAHHKEDAETVESWPGCEGYDDVTIVGR